MATKGTDENLKREYFFCEVCREKITNPEAEKTDYLHCGRKMAPLEVAYMSDPSPTGA